MLETDGTVDKSLAIALLKWNDPDIEYFEPILEPIYYQARKARPASLLDQTKLQLTLYPNPAYDYVTVRYNLPNSTSQSMAIVVTDAMGRETINKALQSISGELILDIRHLAKGAYNVCLKEGNQLKANQKLIIVK
jgi:hypothetical protein